MAHFPNAAPTFRTLLALGTLMFAAACGSLWEDCPSTVPVTLNLSLSLSYVPLQDGPCANACAALVTADNAQMMAQAAANCSVALGSVADCEGCNEADGGPGVVCNGVATSTVPAMPGTSCNTVCLELFPATEVDDCAFTPDVPVFDNYVGDGGPTVSCSGVTFAITDSVLGPGGPDCQSLCLDVLNDGGSAYLPIDPPAATITSCGFVSSSNLYILDAGTYIDAGPGVACTWQEPYECGSWGGD
jgi:hypothetical protein